MLVWGGLGCVASSGGSSGSGDKQQTCLEEMSKLGLALQAETTDEGALSRLIFIETGWVASKEENGTAMAALAATVMNRHEFLNQKGLKQSETGGFGTVGANIQDIIYSRGKNKNGISNIGIQYAGFTPQGISSKNSMRVTAALQSNPASGDCQHLIGAIGYAQTALNIRSAIDPFGGKTWGVRTATAGPPGWGGEEYEIKELAGQVFYGWKGWR